MNTTYGLLSSDTGVSTLRPRAFPRHLGEDWVTKLTWIWQPTEAVELRQRTGRTGFLFLTQLPGDLFLFAGVGEDGVDMCTLIRGRQCVIWDKHRGDCLSGNFCLSLPTKVDTDELADEMKVLIRRNCFLAGASTDATTQERREWIQGMHLPRHKKNDLVHLQ